MGDCKQQPWQHDGGMAWAQRLTPNRPESTQSSALETDPVFVVLARSSLRILNIVYIYILHYIYYTVLYMYIYSLPTPPSLLN